MFFKKQKLPDVKRLDDVVRTVGDESVKKASNKQRICKGRPKVITPEKRIASCFAGTCTLPIDNFSLSTVATSHDRDEAVKIFINHTEK